MTTMTVSQALAEVTLLDKRITKRASTLKVFTVTLKDKAPLGFKSSADYIVGATGELQTLKQLILNRTKIKVAILKSNMETTIALGDETITVTEAIIRRETAMKFIPLLHKRNQAIASDCLRQIQQSKAQAESSITAATSSLVQSTTDQANITDALKAVRAQFEDSMVLQLLEPSGLLASLDTGLESHQDMIKDIDHTLSVSNATTSIEV